MEKCKNAQGQTGVLVSPGFGAGWSTWGDDREYLAMDKNLVELKLRGATEDEVAAHIEKEKGHSPYMGGWGNVEVVWLDEGTCFYIEEYDGSESLRLVSDLDMTA